MARLIVVCQIQLGLESVQHKGDGNRLEGISVAVVLIRLRPTMEGDSGCAKQMPVRC